MAIVKPFNPGRFAPLLVAAVLASSCAGLHDRYTATPPPPLEPFTSPAGGAAATPPAENPLRLTVSEAVLRSLEGNRSLSVQRYAPAIRKTTFEQAEAAFDPVLSGQVGFDYDRAPSPGSEEFDTARSTSLDLSVEKTFPVGTTVGIDAGKTFWNEASTDVTRFGITISQPLASGFGAQVNLAGISQAGLDTRISEYELRGFAESLTAQVEQAYWDHSLALRRIEIVQRSMALAEQQLSETEARIAVGKLAEIELVAARSELALRQEDLINAKSALERSRLGLLRLVNPGGDGMWDLGLDLVEIPYPPPGPSVDGVEDHVEVALRMRPDLNQARLQIMRGDLEVVKTKNGVLPRLDAFLSLGKSGYSDSFFGSFGELTGSGYDLRVGLSGEVPILNRAAQAANRRAVLARDQAAEALENLVSLAQVDVRIAHLEVTRLVEQIAATGATRLLQEEKVRAETEKFRVGRSTSFQVAMAQRDLLASQVAEVEAVVNHLKALVELYRLEGSLLGRRGIMAPGGKAMELP